MDTKLHEALLDLMTAINSPQSEDKLLRNARVTIDRALVQLLVRIRLRRQPLSVGELAGQTGQDQSMVSHQLRKLEGLGLIIRRAVEGDERTRALAVTESGARVVEKIGKARERMVGEALQASTQEDREELSRLIRRLADSTSASMRRL